MAEVRWKTKHTLTYIIMMLLPALIALVLSKGGMFPIYNVTPVNFQIITRYIKTAGQILLTAD